MRLSAALFALTVTVATPLAGAAIGHMSPPPPLTAARLIGLPPAARVAWRAYLDRSAKAMARDKAALAAERLPGAPVPPPPPEVTGHRDTVPLDRDPVWYAGAEARAVGDNIVSFQTPAGGWGKNQDRSGPPRAHGQDYIPHDDRGGGYLAQDGAGGWSFVGTIDNDATTTELTFLARLGTALPGAPGERYRASFAKGIHYLLDAEMPGGGWPQVYPLQGGYHDALTLNDDAMVKVTALLQRTAAGTGDYAFVSAALRSAARDAVTRSIATLIATQVVVNGRRAIWGQQYDPLTYRVVGARNFEPIALATGESATVLRFLMAQPTRSPEIRRAVEDGVAWFAAHGLRDVAWATGAQGRHLVPRPGAGPIWARFYDPATGKPVFGDRDRSVHDDVNEISLERRNGYSWFNNSGAAIATAYARWRGADRLN